MIDPRKIPLRKARVSDFPIHMSKMQRKQHIRILNRGWTPEEIAEFIDRGWWKNGELRFSKDSIVVAAEAIVTQ